MPETRGYASINDRTDGWGPGIDPAAQPTVDAPFEPPRDDDAQPVERDDVYDAEGNVILGDNTGDATMPGAQRRWTRELEQRFSRRAVINPDIEDRDRAAYEGETGDFDRSAGVVGHDTKIYAGKQDAYDEDSYSARIFNRPTHHGDLAGLEGDFFLHMDDDQAELARASYKYDDSGRTIVNPDGTTYAGTGTVDPNADNRDRLSGWGINEGHGLVHPGAGAWSQGTEQQRPLDDVTYYPDTEYADAELPNADTEHESDYIVPNDGPEGAIPADEEVE